MNKGFTFIEMLLYITVFTLVVGAIGTFLFWTVRSQARAIAENDVTLQGSRAMEILHREIQGALAVYTPTSSFETHPGQLSLQTTSFVPQGETTSYVDFFLCGKALCVKREGQNPLQLTSGNVSVSNFVVREVSSDSIPSLRIDLALEINPQTLPEYQAVISLTSTSSLRTYGE